ncbi:GIY-YIG nuclease family protein [Noviherbaspirillum sedimenti]|uniref:Excinuclease cho n=1 Tax=Noviherbaspirillum sedimenti TaxID=2320865 RepID=A0A3A3G7U4_9BURK|nr:GIY-YIG nuclease family protein [Noviherbaspirillum sedimenti]RJG03884.1 endonuclease [Noviherbaspirillum sedimenti]
MRPRVTSVGLIMPSRPAEDFEYPAHIDRASLAALPPKPGVYFFRNRAGEPLYIGKSVNLRARVLAHLRAPEEMAMLAESRHVDFLPTAGEIGALLLESHLIKRYQPAYNVLLRFAGESFALYLKGEDSRPQVIGHSEAGGAEAAGLHGLFASRSEAEQEWRALVRRHQLCPALLGLETSTHGRACFAHQVGHCRGACIGRETLQAHRQRLQLALEQLNAAVWPYGGPIGIVEMDAQWRQVHVIDRWSYLGSLEGRRRKIALPARRHIDIDTYKILARPLAAGTLTYVTGELEHNRARQACAIFREA